MIAYVHHVELRRGMVSVHRGRKYVYSGTVKDTRVLAALLVAACDRLAQVHPFVDDAEYPTRCALCWQLAGNDLHEGNVQ